jgi:hypothetical protein
MTASQSIYEGADAIIENVGRLLKLVQRLGDAISINISSGTQNKSQVSPLTASMTSTAIRKPWIHATMVSIIDLSLAHGHYPKLEDLPLSLQRPQAKLMFPLFSGIATTEEMIGQPHVEDNFDHDCNRLQLDDVGTWDDSILLPTYSQANTALTPMLIGEARGLWDVLDESGRQLEHWFLQGQSEGAPGC